MLPQGKETLPAVGVPGEPQEADKEARALDLAPEEAQHKVVVSSQTNAKDSDDNLILSKKQRRYRRLQFATLCGCFILEGWNDGSTGPLLPRIQQHYSVNYTVVSLLFVFMCAGFLCGATLNVYLTDRLGFGKVIVIGTAVQVVVWALETAAPPFPVWLFAFSMYGFGTALQNAQVNAFQAGLNNPAQMAVLHAAYGSGALASPFVATQFAQMERWSFHYFTALGLGLCTLLSLITTFRFKTQNELLVEGGLKPGAVDTDSRNKYHQILSLRVVHVLAFFILAYCGIEVTIGGWTVTYIMERTNGGSSSGYVASGFFGGLTAGRLLLLWVNKRRQKIGERRVIFVYAAIAIGLEIVIWLVPSLVPDAIAISLVGVLLGPMFPIVMNQCGFFIPRWLLPGSIGWIVSFGLLGNALFPFMTGALSTKYGIISLQPLLIGMMVFMTCIWGLVVVFGSRTENTERSSGDDGLIAAQSVKLKANNE